MKEALVSIITPVFNAGRFISATLESVKLQRYQNWEHLIVLDRNCNDNSAELVQVFAQRDSRIRIITATEGSGASYNRNLALENARGHFVAFLDADDLWHSEKLSRQLHFMQTNSIDFSFTAYTRLTEDGSQFGKVQKVPPRVSRTDLLRNNFIACLTVVYDFEKFKDLRFQNEGWEDLALWLQILKQIPFAYSINVPLAYYRIVKGSRSNNKIFALKLRWQTYRRVEHFSIPVSIYYFFSYAVFGLLKHLRF